MTVEMTFHSVWSLIILPTLLTFTLPFLRKGIKGKPDSKSKEPSRVFWLGRGDGLFADARSKLWTFIKGRQLFADAYFKYSSKNVVTKISTISIPLVLVPKDRRKWFFKERSDVLDHRATGFDAVESLYTMPCGYILDFPAHVKLIHKVLTRELPNLTDDLIQEIEEGLLKDWGTDAEKWRGVEVWATVLMLVTRTFNRISVGNPLCGDEKYLTNTRKYVTSIHAMSSIIRVFPGWTKPVVGSFFSIPCWYYYRRGKGYAMPLIHSYLEEARMELETNGEFSNRHNVFAMWIVQEALRSQIPREMDPETIYARLMTMNFAGIHTSSFTTVNMLLDSLSRPDIFEVIKEEVNTTYSRHNSKWTKPSVDELRSTDNVLRESMRLSGPIVRLIREVKAEDGIEINGVVLPKGTKIATDMHNMHRDEEIYKDANTFNPFRLDPSTGQRMLPAVETSENFLPFGHGRHGCPGRYFASHEIKLIIATIILRYNVKFLEKRPPNVWMGDSMIPPRTILQVQRQS
ncbi:cytochrome P450, putative [Talaromyces stipitatus ATCC 10500]|uniref:Cytochrome P450, putative n=1 Tax=Talaromyces stipitatus (strain ATCC 10500 / CBS 375.48 / QM 6759 / NRRL 1006) TaxID=441959 RepID=B8LX02_TALSN|nr:cytochrome P450, putative [Talaromyces stipitatus ATCC 10500]EED24635.1 cytochrome P450, putative [Talaromyces stipitatus ATCC 10500]